MRYPCPADSSRARWQEALLLIHAAVSAAEALAALGVPSEGSPSSEELPLLRS